MAVTLKWGLGVLIVDTASIFGSFWATYAKTTPTPWVPSVPGLISICQGTASAQTLTWRY